MKYKKIRVYLTLLAIAIGIAAVISIFAISEGAQDQIKSQLEAFGPRNLVVIPGSISGGSISGGIQLSNFRNPTEGKLYEKDYYNIKSTPPVKYITRRINTQTSIEYKKDNFSATLAGVEPTNFLNMMKIGLAKGRFIEDNERGVAVIGQQYTDGSFFKKNQMDIGSKFYAYADGEKKEFRVIGILDASNQVTKNSIIVNIEDAKEIATKNAKIEKNELSAIGVQIAEGYSLSEAVDIIENKLKATRKLKSDQKDFTIVTVEFILQQVNSILGLVTLFFGFIAGVSFLIGSIGIANTIYMGVIERTKEIGILRAVGATKKDVLLIFLIEGAIFGLIGSIVGILLAFAIGWIVSNFGIWTNITIANIILGITLSTLVGVLASYIPAKVASEIDPIRAISSAGR